MKRYIVETLEMTQNFYVIEAESDQSAREISQYASDNWHNTLQTTHVSCNELDEDYLNICKKNNIGMILRLHIMKFAQTIMKIMAYNQIHTKCQV